MIEYNITTLKPNIRVDSGKIIKKRLKQMEWKFTGKWNIHTDSKKSPTHRWLIYYKGEKNECLQWIEMIVTTLTKGRFGISKSAIQVDITGLLTWCCGSWTASPVWCCCQKYWPESNYEGLTWRMLGSLWDQRPWPFRRNQCH